jgi:hypothetical protein
VRLLCWQLFANSLKFAQPGYGKMTVLKNDPVTILDTLLDHLLSFWALTLSERDLHTDLLLCFGIFLESVQWIGTWRKHENQRKGWSGILKDQTQIEWWWSDEIFSDPAHNEV